MYKKNRTCSEKCTRKILICKKLEDHILEIFEESWIKICLELQYKTSEKNRLFGSSTMMMMMMLVVCQLAVIMVLLVSWYWKINCFFFCSILFITQWITTGWVVWSAVIDIKLKCVSLFYCAFLPFGQFSILVITGKNDRFPRNKVKMLIIKLKVRKSRRREGERTIKRDWSSSSSSQQVWVSGGRRDWFATTLFIYYSI